jgi:hypothetical protein
MGRPSPPCAPRGRGPTERLPKRKAGWLGPGGRGGTVARTFPTPEPCPEPTPANPPRSPPAGCSRSAVNYELFNNSNVGIRPWSWNYRSCWLYKGILVKCFRFWSSFIGHRISPLALKYESPRITLIN